MQEILDVVGYDGKFRVPQHMTPRKLTQPDSMPLAFFQTKSPWEFSPRSSNVTLPFSGDLTIPFMVGLPMVATRPLAFLRAFKSQIDNYDTKGLALDATINAFSERLPGAAYWAHYGSIKEMARTASHIKAISRAFHAGLSRVIVLDDEGFDLRLISWDGVRAAIDAAELKLEEERVEKNIRGRGSVVLQLVLDDPRLWLKEREKANGSRIEAGTIVPRRPEMRGANFYALLGRGAMRSFADLWLGDKKDEDRIVKVPAHKSFIVDRLLYSLSNTINYFAPRAMRGCLIEPSWIVTILSAFSSLAELGQMHTFRALRITILSADVSLAV